MPTPITPAPVNNPVSVAPNSQADSASQLAGKTLQQGQPGTPRAQYARHVSEASTRQPEPPGTQAPAQRRRPDRLTALGADLTPHITVHLKRDEVAALAATSGTIRRAVWAHRANARMLDAWQQYELERWDEGSEPDVNEDEEAGRSWHDVYQHLHERLVQADAARFGRTAATSEELNAAYWASARKFDELAALLQTADDVQTRINRLRQIVERLTPLMATFVSRGEDAHARLRHAFANRASSSGLTNDKVEALHAALDEIKRAGPPELQLILKDIEHALLEQTRVNMARSAREIFSNLLEALRINNGSVTSRVTNACNNVSRLAALRETSNGKIADAGIIISSALNSSLVIFSERSSQALMDLRAGLMEINLAHAPEALQPVLGEIDALLKAGSHHISDELAAAVIAIYAKFEELIRALSTTQIEVRTRMANACEIIVSAEPIIEKLAAHRIDVSDTLQWHLRFTIEHCSREQCRTLRLSLNEIAKAGPPEFLLPALRHIGATLEWADPDS